MKKMKKWAIVFLAIVLAASALAGCGGGNSQTANVDFEVTTDGNYPIDTDETVTYWVQMHESVAANFGSLNETVFHDELVKQTGINVEFQHPPVTQVVEQFNLMIASREFPDIIEWGWYSFTGGPHKAIEDEIILPLNKVFDKAAPNLLAFMDKHEGWKKDVMTDEGEYYCFPMFRETDYLNTFYGPMIRKDYLDKAGLDVPETIDEWEKMLYAFKEQGVEVPLSLPLDKGKMDANSAFLGAYGVKGGMYVEDGKVKYGPIEEEAFTPFVEKMTKWYADGILDPNFVDVDNSRLTQLGISGTWGVLFSSCGGGFGSYIPTIKAKNPQAEFVPAKYPVMNKGERPKFGQKNFNATTTGGSAAITTQCKNVELAARLLDFGYSDAGFMLYGFGKEGESYEMKDGIPTYTKTITDNEDGQPMSYMIAKYARASYFGPMIQPENYMKQYAKLDVQKAGIEAWAQNDNTDYALPAVTLTAEENSEYSTIMNDVGTYMEETMYKFITGVTSLDELPGYYAEMKRLGIERAIEINQTAYERYIAR
ncbi:MAG: extracellular solute-binding protein [Clostridia bacterium]|nr:extracellular solute-binding protein [Clostridia bacterium]